MILDRGFSSKMGKNKAKGNQNKRVLSSDGSTVVCKHARNGGSSESDSNTVRVGDSVADTIHAANSVLYNSTSALDNTVFENENDEFSCKSPCIGDNGDNSDQSGYKVLIGYLKRLELKVDNMDKRLAALDSLESKVSSFESELVKLRSYVYENMKKSDEKLNTVSDRCDSVEYSVGVANDQLSHMHEENAKLKDDLLYLQSQSMRNNLVFANIEESNNEMPAQTETILRSFLHEKLNLAKTYVDDIKFERVHRTQQAPRIGNKPRNIVAKFTLYKDREHVRSKGKELRNTQYSMFEQYPKAIADRRRALLPRMKAARRDGKSAWLSYDRLYIDGRPVPNNSQA